MDHLGTRGLLPHRRVCLLFEALIDHRQSHGWGSHHRQPELRPTAQGKAHLGQRLVFDVRRAKAKAGHGADRSNGPQQMEPCLPRDCSSQIAPANIRQPEQPACSPTLGIPGRDPSTVEGFIGTPLGRQELHEA